MHRNWGVRVSVNTPGLGVFSNQETTSHSPKPYFLFIFFRMKSHVMPTGMGTKPTILTKSLKTIQGVKDVKWLLKQNKLSPGK